MMMASISITNDEVSSDGDDDIPSHWPTFEEVGGVRWDWDELSILSDSDDEDAEGGTLPNSSRQRRTHCQQHSQRRRRQKKARQGCILFIIAIYNIIFYTKYFHLDHSSPHLELTVKLPKSPSLSTSNIVQRNLRPVRPHNIGTIYPTNDNNDDGDMVENSNYLQDSYAYIKRFGKRFSAQLRSYIKA